MRILYIDTTTSNLYIGIVENDILLSEIKHNYGKDLSKVALLKISELLDKNNLKPNDINKIIVVNGPGSFTGIRIGVTIAKTFAYSLNIDITTISSLQAMAISNDKNTYKIPVIDARRGFVYAAIYDNELNTVLKEQYLKMDTLMTACDHLLGDYTFIGNDLNYDISYEEYDPNILNIVKKFRDKENINPHAVNPIYLKETEAEENQKVEII